MPGVALESGVKEGLVLLLRKKGLRLPRDGECRQFLTTSQLQKQAREECACVCVVVVLFCSPSMEIPSDSLLRKVIETQPMTFQVPCTKELIFKAVSQMAYFLLHSPGGIGLLKGKLVLTTRAKLG